MTTNRPRPRRRALPEATEQAIVAADEPNHRQILAILGGLMVGMFLASLDQMIVATSIRTIGDSLHGLSMQAWVTTAYLITSTIATPLYGKFSDIYGRKPCYVLAIALFLIGSLLSGSAGSMHQLAAYRAVQGLGAGGLMSLAFTIIGDVIPPRERARYQGASLAVMGTSSVLGPVVGGFFAGAETILGIDGWRWVFLVNLPIGILGLVFVLRVLHLPPLARVAHRIDWPGALSLVVGLVPLLLVAQQGRAWGWGSARSLACIALGVAGIALFLLAERAAGPDAILPLHLFRNRTFAICAATSTVVGLGMFGGIATLPLYLQIVQGMSPTRSGLMLIPLTLGVMCGSISAGQFTARTGRYKILPMAGTTLLALGAFLLTGLTVDTSLAVIGAKSIVFGLGIGLTMAPLVLAVQNAVPPGETGVGTSSSVFFRQLGGTLGTAVLLSVLFSTVRGKIAGALVSIAPTADFQAALADPAVLADRVNKPVLDMLSGASDGSAALLNDSSFISALDPRLGRPFLVGFAESIDLVVVIVAAVMVIGIVLTVMLPELPLRAKSGIQSRQEAEVVAGAAAAAGGTGTAGSG